VRYHGEEYYDNFQDFHAIEFSLGTAYEEHHYYDITAKRTKTKLVAQILFRNETLTLSGFPLQSFAPTTLSDDKAHLFSKAFAI
jgi:hypothetical protein